MSPDRFQLLKFAFILVMLSSGLVWIDVPQPQSSVAIIVGVGRSRRGRILLIAGYVGTESAPTKVLSLHFAITGEKRSDC